jgi:thiol:disulfide interchange protein DsbD
MNVRLRLLSSLLIVAGAAMHAVQAQDILRPEQAFPYTLSAEADRLVLSFDVPDGYYLYRERFDFGSATPAVRLGNTDFPRGKIYEDEFFGEMEIYRGKFEIGLPYTRRAAADAVELQLELQGCADIGLCYPPQKWTASTALPAGGFDIGQAGAPLFSQNGNDLLPAEEAFVLNARFDRANELTVSWQIAPGYYLYADKFTFAVDGDIGLGAAVLPEGEPHYDDNFGDITVFYDYVEAVIPFSRASPNEMPVTVRAGYQGCKENSICYPPGEQIMALTLPASSEFAASGSAASGSNAAAPLMVSEQDRLAALVLSDSWFIVLGTFYGLGLLLAFTPCVLPMVPILSGIIAGQGNVSASRGFALSFTYVMGMAITYTAAGALAAVAGEQIQAIFQKPWIITLFAGMFAILALGMFGLFELQMPAAVQTRLANMANRQKAGTFVGTAIIGALSALIVTTCVAPPLVATLAVIGQSGDVVRGAAALFALSLGMGSPLLLVGASAGKLLPKAGAWMNTVKAGFGVMMLGLAIWMMERVLPGTVTLTLWALLVFLTGVFLGAFEPLPAQPSATRRLSKGLGVLACLYGALMLIGATLGGDDPMRPLPRGGLMSSTSQNAGPALAFQAVESVAALETALADARAAGRPVMVDFTADWCVSCKEMEEYTFPDANVIGALAPFSLLRADVTANDDDDQALLQYFNSYGPPTIAFFDSQGRAQEGFKLVGYVPAEDFAAHVEQLAAL